MLLLVSIIAAASSREGLVEVAARLHVGGQRVMALASDMKAGRYPRQGPSRGKPSR